ITSQLPSVTCLPVHLPGEQTILWEGNNNLSTLQCYFLCPTNIEFDALIYLNGILYSNFQDVAYVFGLLEDINENEQCFAEAVTYKCTPAQLRLLFCCLILEGIVAQSVWQIHHELLLADYINKKGDIQQGENDALMWIASFLEEH
ncbi:10263_t:CDS:2, partial [Scutellospora calospora]